MILPTIQECIEEVESGYAQTGLERFKARKGERIPSVNVGAYVDYVLRSTHILPIYSDPTLADSDGELSQALFDALNDYLNQIMPPVYDENGEKITNKNKECTATWNHFNEYIWQALLENGDKPEQRHAAYIVWLRDAYGLNGAEKIWLTSERYVEIFYNELIDEDIVERALKQVTLGNYYDDVTLTGTAG